MQLIARLRTVIILSAVLALSAVGVPAQSVSPMRNEGPTPSTVKGFRIDVGNPYAVRMTFDLIPMEPGFEIPAGDAEVIPPQVTLAPRHTRQVILAFKIPDTQKERIVGLCVQPHQIEGNIFPRVCGLYTGTRLIPADSR